MTATFDTIQYSGLNTGYSSTQAYNTNVLTRWDGSNAAQQPKVANNIGYDVTAPLSPARREAAYRRANGTLCDGTYWWPLFVFDVSIDIALAGTTAQARSTRDFYPHNFTQPGFTVQGQAIDQRDYGALTDFIHHMQLNSVSDGSKLIQLYIRGNNGADGARTGHVGVTKNKAFLPNQVLRGSHRNILCLGYINSMPRRHETGVYATPYSFDFIVADMITGPYSEDMVQVVQQQNWVDLLHATQTFKVDQALVKENNQALGWAQRNAANVISGSA